VTIKIENKPASRGQHYHRGDWGEFLAAVKALEVGQSFVFAKPQSNHRLALSIAQAWLGGKYVAIKERGDTYRIGRTS
jgi:hypothetical protein